MNDQILPLIEAWDGNGVVIRHDVPTSTWIFIALHSSALGSPTGGTRMRVYPGLRDALRDAMRLAAGMTHKWAALDMGFGGGKAVLAISRPLSDEDRRGLMLRYGDLLESLDGAFYTGADLGTGPKDMSHIAQRTKCVLGVDPQTGKATDPGPFTARGVLSGIQAAANRRFGSSDLTGCRVMVQGLGGVGGPLCHLLEAEGVELLLCDVDEARAEGMAAEIGAKAIPADRVFTEPCDIFSPCAIGGILNENTIATLGCKVVVGSANNQLLEEDDADRLQKWGILYVPDYIVNAGGAMAISLMHQGVEGEENLFERVSGIGQTVTETTPLESARRRVDRLLAKH